MEIEIRQSEMYTWVECRRKHKFQYADGYARKEREFILPPSKANIGTIVHSGLEHYYRDGASPAAWVSEQAKRIAAEWAEQGEQMSPAWKDAYNLAYLMCKGYTEWLESTGADAGWTVTGVEREVRVFWGNINGVDVYVTGHIDLEVIDALGRVLIVDHKSVAGIGADGGPPDFQRLTYAVLRQMEDGTTVQELIHNQLKRVKRTGRATPPFYGRQSVSFNMDQLRKHHQHMAVIIEEILQHRGLSAESPRLYPHPTRDCSWKCSMYELCPLVDDGGDWQEMLDARFVQEGAHVPGEER